MVDGRFATQPQEQFDMAPEQPAANHLAVETLGSAVPVTDESTGSHTVKVITGPTVERGELPEPQPERPAETDQQVIEHHLAGRGLRQAAFHHGPRMPRGRDRPGGR